MYSINEQTLTVALQNVRSFGTEGREKAAAQEGDTEGSVYQPPSDMVHPFLLFRGQDIKDLKVHETPDAPPNGPAASPPPPTASAPQGVAAATPAVAPVTAAPATVTSTTTTETAPTTSDGGAQKQAQPRAGRGQGGRGSGGRRGGGGGRGRTGGRGAAPGTGASLLNRKARGVTHSAADDENLKEDFDFQSNLEQFKKEDDDNKDNDEDENEAGDTIGDHNPAYEKDDFFDNISCEVTDRQAGIDNRLKGSKERDLNTETFGAVALNTNYRRRGYGGRGGRGRGRGRGRGGRGRGRGPRRNHNEFGGSHTNSREFSGRSSQRQSGSSGSGQAS